MLDPRSCWQASRFQAVTWWPAHANVLWCLDSAARSHGERPLRDGLRCHKRSSLFPPIVGFKLMPPLFNCRMGEIARSCVSSPPLFMTLQCTCVERHLPASSGTRASSQVTWHEQPAQVHTAHPSNSIVHTPRHRQPPRHDSNGLLENACKSTCGGAPGSGTSRLVNVCSSMSSTMLCWKIPAVCCTKKIALAKMRLAPQMQRMTGASRVRGFSVRQSKILQENYANEAGRRPLA